MDNLDHPAAFAPAYEPNDSPLPLDSQQSAHRWLRGAALVSGGILSATIAGAFYVVDVLTKASKVTCFDDYTFTPFELSIPSEDVRIPSGGGDALSGWWLPRPETNRVILVCYGYRNRKSDMLGVGAALWRRGFNVLIFDYHGHGEHVGTRVTLGYRELEDALAAVRFIFRRLPEARLGILGYSMGASIAIMAAARDGRVEAIVADSPFSAQRNPVIRRMRQQLHLTWAGRPILFVVDVLLQWQLGYRFSDVEPIRDIRHLGKRPILLVHGTDDTMVDPQDSVLLFEAATGPKDLWQVEGAEHCGAYFKDRLGYVNRVVNFFDNALSSDGVRGTAVEQIELKQQKQPNDQRKYQNGANNGRPSPSLVGARLIAITRLHSARPPAPYDH